MDLARESSLAARGSGYCRKLRVSMPVVSSVRVLCTGWHDVNFPLLIRAYRFAPLRMANIIFNNHWITALMSGWSRRGINHGAIFFSFDHPSLANPKISAENSRQKTTNPRPWLSCRSFPFFAFVFLNPLIQAVSCVQSLAFLINWWRF